MPTAPSRGDHRPAEAAAARARSLRPPASHRRERQRRGRPVARLPARTATAPRLAVAVVHHARKGAGNIRAGQALRGSSEFHAWGDSNLYLRRDSDDRIALTVEHRAAAAIAGVTLELTQRDNALALRPVQADHQTKRAVQAGFHRSAHRRRPRRRRPAASHSPNCARLAASAPPHSIERLAAMTAAGIVVKSADGYASPLAERRALTAPRTRADAKAVLEYRDPETRPRHASVPPLPLPLPTLSTANGKRKREAHQNPRSEAHQTA